MDFLEKKRIFTKGVQDFLGVKCPTDHNIFIFILGSYTFFETFEYCLPSRKNIFDAVNFSQYQQLQSIAGKEGYIKIYSNG